MAHDRFLTAWPLVAPVERVSDTLYDAERRPAWSRGVERTEVVDESLCAPERTV